MAGVNTNNYTEPSGKDSYILTGDGLDRYDELIKAYIKSRSTNVVVTPSLSSGVQIATIKVDNTTKTLYAPDNSGCEGHRYNSSLDSLGEGTNSDRGDYAEATGARSHAEGLGSEAKSRYSHAEGVSTRASGQASHVEGTKSKTGLDGAENPDPDDQSEESYSYTHNSISYIVKYPGKDAHAEGHNTHAIGAASHAEGAHTYAIGIKSHAEGLETLASGSNSHAEGRSTVASSYHAHAEGLSTTASDSCAHAEGAYTEASNSQAHAEGRSTVASGVHSHAEGAYTEATSPESHAEGSNTKASGNGAHAEGCGIIESFTASIRKATSAEKTKLAKYGLSNINYVCTGGSFPDNRGLWKIYTSSSKETYKGTVYYSLYNEGGSDAHEIWGRDLAAGDWLFISSNIEGGSYYFERIGGVANGANSHAEGASTIANHCDSHSEGSRTIAYGANSHAEGGSTFANGANAHAEGDRTLALNYNSHAEGSRTIAGLTAHAEGSHTMALGKNSHAEGCETVAFGNHSHVSGSNTVANHDYETAIGKWNISRDATTGTNPKGSTLFSVGIGSSTNAERKNAFEVLDDGRIYIFDIDGIESLGNSGKTLVHSLQELLKSMSDRIETLENQLNFLTRADVDTIFNSNT